MECAISFAEMTEKAAQPSPYSFIQNRGALKIHRTFPLSDEGMDEAIAWLFERFETEKSKWLNASRDAMHIVNNQTF